MPRPSKFDDTQILEAAGQLQADNLPVTGYALSVKLGGGRPSSLLERYVELTANVEKPAELPALPSDLAATIEKAAAGVMQQLTTAMTEAHASVKAQAHVRIDEIEAELAQARKLHAAELDDAAEHLGAMQERAEAAEASLALSQKEGHTLKEALSALEGELKASGQYAEKLEKQLAIVREEAKKSDELCVSANNASLQARKEAEAAKAAADEANKQREAAAKEAAANAALVAQLRATEQRLQQELAGLNQATGKQAAQVTQLTDEKARLIERAKAQKDAHAAELATLQQKLSEQAKALDAQAKEVQALKASLEGSKRG